MRHKVESELKPFNSGTNDLMTNRWKKKHTSTLISWYRLTIHRLRHPMWTKWPWGHTQNSLWAQLDHIRAVNDIFLHYHWPKRNSEHYISKRRMGSTHLHGVDKDCRSEILLGSIVFYFFEDRFELYSATCWILLSVVSLTTILKEKIYFNFLYMSQKSIFSWIGIHFIAPYIALSPIKVFNLFGNVQKSV